MHLLIVAKAPKWEIEKVDQGCRAFFWVRSDALSDGNWEWLRRMDDYRPWQGLNLVTDKQVQCVFNSLVTWEIVDDKRIMFWKDKWVHGNMIVEIAPGLVAKVKTRTINARRASEGLYHHEWTNDIPGNLLRMS
ncbi:Serine/threonine-phosphatase BSL2-like protein [Hordeum vulgare]|nr:Serine/threonine-phosphatase BSL2-like protein [Hordeum vulgare]